MAVLSNGNGGNSLSKWVIGVILAAIIWLASGTVSGWSRDIKALKESDAIHTTEIAVINSRYEEIIRRLSELQNSRRVAPVTVVVPAARNNPKK